MRLCSLLPICMHNGSQIKALMTDLMLRFLCMMAEDCANMNIIGIIEVSVQHDKVPAWEVLRTVLPSCSHS